MMRKKLLICFMLMFFSFPSLSFGGRPPKPGPNFVWIKGWVTESGVLIKGHWKYKGPPMKARVWVPGHYKKNGKWVPGHYKKIKRKRKNAVWVPGHHSRQGYWVPGHWK